ncbi:MAG: sigma-54-dependent Fis family transcriptional regulator, partial [Myxococcales bacterium]|nr:sigma-54-dependent Fis family transcriptional regulator [Myxococcales bacterium]
DETADEHARGGPRAEAALALAVAGGQLPARLVRSSATTSDGHGPGAAPRALRRFREGVRDLLRAGEVCVDEELVVLREDVARAALARASPATRVDVSTAVRAALGHFGAVAGPWTGYLAAAVGELADATVSFERAIAALLAAGRVARALRLATDAHALTSAPLFAFARADALARQGRYADAMAALADEPSLAARVRRAELARRAGEVALAEALATACLAELGARLESESESESESVSGAPIVDVDVDVDVHAHAHAHGDVDVDAHAHGDGDGDGDAHDNDVLAHDTVSAGTGLATALGNTLGWIALGAGDLARARRHARAADLRAWIALTEGGAARARAVASDALAAPLQRGRRGEGAEARARVLLALGAAEAALAALDRAARAHHEALTLASAIGDEHLAATAAANEGIVGLDAGALGAGQRALREAARRYARIGRDRDLGRAVLNLASAAGWVGDEVEAERLARAARDALTRAADGVGLGRIALIELELALRAGRNPMPWSAPDEPNVRARAAALLATAALDEARRLLVGLEASPFELGVARARVALAEGDTAGASACLETLAEPPRWEDQLLLAQLAHDVAAAQHDRPGAEAALGRVRALLDRVSRDLDAHQRRTLRRFGPYARALATAPREVAVSPKRHDWRQLLTFFRELELDAPLDDLRRRIVRGARRFLDAERAFLLSRSESGALEVNAADGDGAPSLSIAARAIDLAAPVRAHDAMGDARWTDAKSVHALALRSVLAAPVGDEGALLVDDRQRPAAFSDEDGALLVELADLAKRSIEEAKRRAADRRALRREIEARRALERRVEVQAEELAARRAETERYGLVARSPAMRAFVELLGKVAATDAPALLVGESGTGKNHAARVLHDASGRASGPFVAESCAAMPETLLESTLFGHERGAFSGATARRRGLFELAHGGTLFLDDVEQTSPAMQAKLLRAVQEGEVRPLGSERSRRFDVRLVTATSVDLRAYVRDARFREDLFYRLAVLVLPLPPLRERREDLPDLVRALLERLGAPTVRVASDALGQLASRAWPGNVRELETALRRALLAAGDARILRLEHFAADEEDGSLELREHVDALERRLVRDALARAGGNRTRAAELLGLSRFGLQKKMKRLGLEGPEPARG